MATLEIEGKIKTKLAPQSGSGARGSWIKQDFILEYPDGNFTAEACLNMWGQDKVDELAKFGVGDAVKVSFNIRSREYQGRWYNDLRAWRIVSAGQPASSRQSSSQPVPPPGPAAPPPTIDDMPADFSQDDLPF